MRRYRQQQGIRRVLQAVVEADFHALVEIASWGSLVLLLLYGTATTRIASMVTVLLLAPAKAMRIVTVARYDPVFARTVRLLEQELGESETENVRLANEKRILLETEAQMFDQIKRMQVQIEQVGQQSLDCKAERDAMQNECDRLQAEFQFHLEAISNLESQIRDYQATQRVHSERMSEQAMSFRDQLTQRDMIISELKAELAMAKQDFKFKKDQITQDLNGLEKHLAQLQGENNLLQRQIAELSAPKRLQPTTWYHDLGNRVSDWIGEGGHPIHLVRVEEDHGLVSLFFRPIKRHSLNAIEGMSDDLRLEFHLLRRPSVRVQSDGTVALHLYTDRNASSAEERIIQPPEQWLEKSLVLTKDGKPRANHARFVGESESGKSTLVNNCIGLNKQYLPNLRVILADPLYDSKTKEEQQRDWSFVPDYKNDRECLEGLVWLELELDRRKQNPERKQQTVIFILDEVDTMAADYPEITRVIKKIWKQGRHVNLYLWIIGQSPLVKPLNLGVMDVNNAVCFYLNETIVRGLADAFIPADVMVRWQNQFHQRRSLNERFIVFVRPKQDLPFMANSPRPDLYTTVAVAEDRNQPLPSYDELEFNLEETRRRLENLVNEGGEGLEVRIKELARQGKKPYEIVYAIWKIRPSRGGAYKDRIHFVHKVLQEE